MIRELLLGRRLANREFAERKIGAFEGVPAMGLDGLGSSAYGPEAAGLLLVAFGGITDRLIPLFAIGAFATFTLSQTGMVFHWRRELRANPGARSTRVHFWVNAIGASTTAAALIVIVVAKFAEGAWLTLIAIPLVIALLKSIRGYYDEVAIRVRDPTPLTLSEAAAPVVLVAIEEWNKLADKAIAFAMSLSSEVICVHLTQLAGPEGEQHDRELQEQWTRDVVERRGRPDTNHLDS